jgi:long-chain acyl-CoA synthetase
MKYAMPVTMSSSEINRPSSLKQSDAHLVPFVENGDLPLERIYHCEKARANELLFTQPWQGAVQEWTWSQAMQETRRIAAYLKVQNFPPGSRLAIMAKNSAWWIMADFAIWMAGHVSVPIFPSVQDASLCAIFEQSKPVACFLGAVDHLPPFENNCFEGMRWITFPHQAHEGGAAWSDIAAQHEPLVGEPVRPALDLATIIYTSGTTGQPKGVMHTFRSLSLMAMSVKRTIGRDDGETDRMLSYLPLAHIAERAIVETSTFFVPLHVFFTEGQATFLADLQRARPTVFFTIPRLLIRFQQGVFDKLPANKLDFLLKIPVVNSIVRKHILKGLGLSTVRLAASGAAPLPTAVIEWYHRLGLNLVEGYGMTETGITHVPEPGKARIGYVGDASAYAETRISENGEIQIKGPMNFAGYYQHPEATEACFTSDGFFRTGDRGEIDEQNRLRIIGRIKEEFKTSKGKYVVPAQIEKALSLSQMFESVCVLGSGMTAPFAMVVLAPAKRELCAAPDGRAEIEKQLAAELELVNAQHEHHEHLKFLVIDSQPWSVENSLLTPTLKVRRTALENRFSPQFDAWEKQKKSVIWLVPA